MGVTLTEFLSARVDEDETRAHTDSVEVATIIGHPVTRLGAPREVREVAAKRAIMSRHVEEYPGSECDHCMEPLPCPDLRSLASVYSDHPDYDEEWLS